MGGIHKQTLLRMKLKELYGFRTEYPEHAIIFRDKRGELEAPVVGVAVGKDYRHACAIGSMVGAAVSDVDVDRIPVINPQIESKDEARLSLSYDTAVAALEAIAERRTGDPIKLAARVLRDLQAT